MFQIEDNSYGLSLDSNSDSRWLFFFYFFFSFSVFFLFAEKALCCSPQFCCQGNGGKMGHTTFPQCWHARLCEQIPQGQYLVFHPPLQVGDAPSHRDLQCMYIPTEVCASQIPKVTIERLCRGESRCELPSARRTKVKPEWASVTFTAAGTACVGPGHQFAPSASSKFKPHLSCCNLQPMLPQASTMFTFYHPFCIVHPALGLIFREFLTRSQHQHPEGSAFTTKAFAFRNRIPKQSLHLQYLL